VHFCVVVDCILVDCILVDCIVADCIVADCSFVDAAFRCDCLWSSVELGFPYAILIS